MPRICLGSINHFGKKGRLRLQTLQGKSSEILPFTCQLCSKYTLKSNPQDEIVVPKSV